MGDFDVIETGFNSADETINFGTRCFGMGNLYDITTLACLTSSTDTVSVYLLCWIYFNFRYCVLYVYKLII